jgi:hypothetical protein
MADTAFTLLDDQLVTFSVSETDDAGNPVTDLLSAPAWAESSGGAILAIAPSADGSTAVVTAVGPLGDATVTYTATLASGTPVTGSVAVTVAASAAAGVTLVPDAPSHK